MEAQIKSLIASIKAEHNKRASQQVNNLRSEINKRRCLRRRVIEQTESVLADHGITTETLQSIDSQRAVQANLQIQIEYLQSLQRPVEAELPFQNRDVQSIPADFQVQIEGFQSLQQAVEADLPMQNNTLQCIQHATESIRRTLMEDDAVDLKRWEEIPETVNAAMTESWNREYRDPLVDFLRSQMFDNTPTKRMAAKPLVKESSSKTRGTPWGTNHNDAIVQDPNHEKLEWLAPTDSASERNGDAQGSQGVQISSDTASALLKNDLLALPDELKLFIKSGGDLRDHDQQPSASPETTDRFVILSSRSSYHPSSVSQSSDSQPEPKSRIPQSQAACGVKISTTTSPPLRRFTTSLQLSSTKNIKTMPRRKQVACKATGGRAPRPAARLQKVPFTDHRGMAAMNTFWAAEPLPPQYSLAIYNTNKEHSFDDLEHLYQSFGYLRLNLCYNIFLLPGASTNDCLTHYLSEKEARGASPGARNSVFVDSDLPDDHTDVFFVLDADSDCLWFCESIPQQGGHSNISTKKVRVWGSPNGDGDEEWEEYDGDGDEEEYDRERDDEEGCLTMYETMKSLFDLIGEDTRETRQNKSKCESGGRDGDTS